jgi:hypothetical protein
MTKKLSRAFRPTRLRNFFCLLFIAVGMAVLGAIGSSHAIGQHTGGSASQDDGDAVDNRAADGPSPPPCFPCWWRMTITEDFDNVTPPALPGWIATNTQGPPPLWVTSDSGVPVPPADTAPNAVFIDDPAVVSDKLLDSFSFSFFEGVNPRLTFRQNFNLEASDADPKLGFDGGVLEMSTDGGNTFQDILAAGGSFVMGGYNRTISTDRGSPIAGRRAWSGNSKGFITTVVDLPNIQTPDSGRLRWRMASDTSGSGEGWRVDTVNITWCQGQGPPCSPTPPPPTPTPTPTPPRAPCPQYTITEGTGTIVPGTTDTGNHCAWCDTLITLPFPFVLYDQTFTSVMVTSSGRLDFVCDNEPAGYTETCPPAPPNNCPYDFTIFALWHEWYTGAATGCSTWANGCGIFTSISGTAPNRIFNIEWHVVRRENDSQTGNFEVRLYENDPDKRFDMIYGVSQGVDNYHAAGVQGPFEFFTQDFCNVPVPQNTVHTYQLEACGTPTVTPTPTPTPTVTPRVTPRPRPTQLPRPSVRATPRGTLRRTAGSTTAHSPPTPTPKPRVTPHPRPTPPPLPSPTPPIVVDVEVGPGFAFVPSNVYIPVGGTVRWTWAGNGHSVTSGVLCTADEQFCSP